MENPQVANISISNFELVGVRPAGVSNSGRVTRLETSAASIIAANFELAASNYANKGSALLGSSVSGPQGSSATSAGQTGTGTILTAGQNFLGLGGDLPSGFGALGPAVLPAGGGSVLPPLSLP